MSEKYSETWEKYVASWGAESSAEKRALYQLCLDSDFKYNDPLIKTKGWDELIDYMMDFKKQIPGGHFVTTYFLSHSHKSIAKWEMRNGENVTLSEGISYGEHNQEGKLISETGFFEPPES